MNDVTTTGNNEVAQFNDNDFGSVGPSQNITSSDIQLPKLLLMQPGSPKVLEGECNFGELVDASSWEVLAYCKNAKKDAKPLEFIPFHWEKFWIIRKAVGQKFEFDSIEKMTHLNENLDQFETWEENGEVKKRVYTHFFYGIVPGKTLPYVVAFKGASKRYGDQLVTQMFVSNKALKVKEAWKRSPMGKVVHLTPVKENKNNNSFAVLEVSVARESTFEEASEALKSYKALNAGSMKADLPVEDEVVSNKNVNTDSGEF